MDLAKLRACLEPGIVGLSMYTHPMLGGTCADLKMPFPAKAEYKKDRMREALGALQDTSLVQTAELFLLLHPPNPAYRNQIQEILWADVSTPEIDKKTRRDVARALDHDDLYLHASKFDELLDSLFVLDDDSSALFAAFVGRRGVPDRSLRTRIKRHIHDNPGDMTPLDLFESLGALECTHKRFALFLQGLASADVRPDEADLRRFVGIINSVLKIVNTEFRETEIKDGYPSLTLVNINSGNRGKPKNLIFASQVKPDLRFRDAIDNDVEIVTNADKVLIYDRPISTKGLTWSDLQAWWAEYSGITNDNKAKATLCRRLEASLPSNSPPQRLLFKSYFEHFGQAVPALPVLLPEVWLHWDPKTVRERGRDALLRFRMDFLMLLPGGARVVLEVDGKQHYADGEGKASPTIYAQLTYADRELRLAGYDVFRFGAAELQGEAGKVAVGQFFDALFKRYGITPRASQSL